MLFEGQNSVIYGASFLDVRGDIFDEGIRHLLGAASPGAAYNSEERYPSQKCHPGTREEVLAQIARWTDYKPDTDTEKILWLHGSAGVGKTAIAQTAAEHCASRKQLAASFFFARGRADRSSIDRLFTTIAYQISVSIPLSITTMRRNLVDDPSIIKKVIPLQLEKLLIEPLRSAYPSPPNSSSNLRIPPSIVIIDGLDECTTRDEQTQILEHVRDLVHRPGIFLRFLIVSRSEYNIRHAFEKTELSNYCTTKISLDEYRGSHEDVRKYLLDEFSRIHMSPQHGNFMDGIRKPWPPPPDLDLLVERSDSYFFYASVLVRYVSEENFSPVGRLSEVLGTPPGSTIFRVLDQCYMQVLSSPPVGLVRSVLGATLAKVPYRMIAELFQLQPGQVIMIFRKLQSVIQMDRDHTPFPVHPSFSDFIIDPLRSGEFWIDPHANLARTTRAMLDSLRRFATTSRKSPSMAGLPRSLSTVVEFTYQKWLTYLRGAGPDRNLLIKEIKDMNLRCWIALPPEAQHIPWHREESLDLNRLCAANMTMLLSIGKLLKEDDNLSAALTDYFATIRDETFIHLLSPIYSGDWAIIYAFTTLYGEPYTENERPRVAKAMLIQNLLGLERPLPYHSLQILELLTALDDYSASTFPDILKTYLTGADAPPLILLDLELSHAALADRCLILLVEDGDGDPGFSIESTSARQYARNHWVEHLSDARPSDERLLDHLRTIDRKYLFSGQLLDDMQKATQVINWLKKFPKRSKDVLRLWQVYRREIKASLVEARRNEGDILHKLFDDEDEGISDSFSEISSEGEQGSRGVTSFHSWFW